jgi:hypothetical protein
MSKNKMSNLFLDAKTSFLEPKVEQYGSHMIMSNVTKSLKQKYINIDTRFTDEYGYNKNSFNSTTNFVYSFPERIQDVKSIKVISIEIPISFYNFSQAIGNNSFKLIDTSTSTSKMVVIKDGNYSSTGILKTEISNAIHNLGGNFQNIQFDISTNLCSYIDCSAGSSFIAEFDTDSSGNYNKYNFRSKLGWFLGFRDQSFNFVPPSSNFIYSDSIVNLQSMRYLYLVIDEYSSGFTNSFISPMGNSHLMNKKILARICIDYQFYPFGSILHASHSNGLLVSDNRFYNGSVDLQKLNIQLVNEYGVVVNLNGLDFSFVLEIVHE